jgi:RNA polymerase sigma-70 factor (ECF subfamily)
MRLPDGGSGEARPGTTRFIAAPEHLLLGLAMRGETAAFNELVVRRQSWLRNLLRRLCREPALADDLAQQTLLQAWRSLPGLREPAAFGGWLRRLAVNTWLQHVRVRHDTVALDDLPSVAIVAVAIDDAAIGVRIDLDHALAGLRPETRLCVVLAYHEGMSHAEISSATALPLGTVKSHISRGGELLRQQLAAYVEDT